MKECEAVYKLHKELIESTMHSFPKRGMKINVSAEQGVYIIYSPNNEVLHVGTTKVQKMV